MKSTCKHCGKPIEKVLTASHENAWAHITTEPRIDAGTHYYACEVGGSVMAASAADPLPLRIRVTTQVRQADGHWTIHSDDTFDESACRTELVALVKDWDWVAFGYDDPKIPVRRVARKVSE